MNSDEGQSKSFDKSGTLQLLPYFAILPQCTESDVDNTHSFPGFACTRCGFTRLRSMINFQRYILLMSEATRPSGIASGALGGNG